MFDIPITTHKNGNYTPKFVKIEDLYKYVTKSVHLDIQIWLDDRYSQVF